MLVLAETVVLDVRCLRMVVVVRNKEDLRDVSSGRVMGWESASLMSMDADDKSRVNKE